MVGFGSTWTTILKHRGEAGIQLVYQSGSKVSASLGLSFEMICFKNELVTALVSGSSTYIQVSDGIGLREKSLLPENKSTGTVGESARHRSPPRKKIM